jgi:hypothetical protein
MDNAHEDQELRDALREAGLLDPNRPQADARLTALQLLLDRGATMVDLHEHRNDLGLLAARLANLGIPTMTRRQLAGHVEMSLDLVDRLFLAAGLPDPGPTFCHPPTPTWSCSRLLLRAPRYMARRSRSS